MWRIPKHSYTNKFNSGAVRLVDSRWEPAVARPLAISEQTLENWRKTDRAGKLGKSIGRPITPEQMDLSYLRFESIPPKMEMKLAKKTAANSAEDIPCGAPGLADNLTRLHRGRCVRR